MENNYLPVLSYGLKKTDIKNLVENVISELESGNVSGEHALLIAEQISAITEFVTVLKGDDRFVDAVRNELFKYPKGFTSNSGAKLEAIEAGTKYDYSDDFKWLRLNNDLTTIKDNMKERETLLKAIPVGIELADPETGEILSAPVKTSTSTFKVSLAK